MQKISYQSYQILVSLMRGQKYVYKASLIASLAAQKNNCKFCHENVSSSIQGNSAPFCRNGTRGHFGCMLIKERNCIGM